MKSLGKTGSGKIRTFIPKNEHIPGSLMLCKCWRASPVDFLTGASLGGFRWRTKDPWRFVSKIFFLSVGPTTADYIVGLFLDQKMESYWGGKAQYNWPCTN